MTGFTTQFSRIQNYGIRPKDVERMLMEQDHKCAICHDYITTNACVDHDHESGVVRGMLCSGCNKGLGFFRDNELYLQRAVAYLRAAQRR